MNRAVKKIWSLIGTVTVVLVVVFAMLLVGVRVLGIRVYSVVSGSMEPEYPVGSLIYVVSAEPEDISVGDVITYVLPNGTPSTHRVVEIDSESSCFYTKGDANASCDGAPVHFNNLIGRPVFKIPYLGYAAYSIQHPPGIYIAVAVCTVMLILVFMPRLPKRSERRSASPNGADKKKG